MAETVAFAKLSTPRSVGVVDECLPDLFEAQVSRTPNQTAFAFSGYHLTYAELDAAANRVARLLIARGVGPESIVGLLLPRSPQLLIALLGVIKAGAAYLPLDPEYPAARLLAMLDDSGVSQVLTTSGLRRQLQLPKSVPTLLLDLTAIRSEVDSYPATRVTNAERIKPLHPGSLLYVIYTSGSTGQPKGVAVEHRSFVSMIKSMVSRVKIKEGQTWLSLSTICFDPAGMEIFLPLLQGGCLVILSGADSRDPIRVIEAVKQTTIDLLAAVPTFMRALIAGGLPRTIRILMGGEALPSAMVPQLLEFPEAINLYGPTETTVLSSFHRIVPEDATRGAVVTVGKPLESETFYILDGRLSLVPDGCAGELYIAGVGLARGYLNRPELTAERFVDCPFGAPGERMYKTGDLARWRADGNVDFLGRIDQQVKIRGFRIELGEVENTILRLVPAIRECAVEARDIRGQAHLIAYHVNLPGSPVPEAPAIRAMLADFLPDHMIPRMFMRLDRMPLAPNEKLDRRALPQPDENANRQSYRPPVDAMEIAICKIFREVTGAPRVGRDDDFFQIGGNSLAATLCVHRLRRQFDREVTLRQLLGGPTPFALARALARGDVPRAVTVTPSQEYPTIFLLPGMGGDEPQLVRFRMEWEGIARIVPLDYPDWRELLDRDGGMNALVRDFVRCVLNEAPEGPIWLLGYSLGGNCAHAIALQLAAHGREIAFVGLLDSEATPEVSKVLAAQLQTGATPVQEAWQMLQDIGRILRAIRQRDVSRAVALALVRRLTSPWARPVLSWASRHHFLRLPVTLSYYINAYMNEARQVAAIEAWCNTIREAPVPLSAPAFLFRSESHQPGEAADLGWGRYLPQLKVMHLPGTHKTMFEPPHLKTLCDQTRAVIDSLYGGALAATAVRS